MDNIILLDTSLLVSFYNTRDQNHEKALDIMNKIMDGNFGEPCITDYIFDEFATVLLARLKDLSAVSKIGEDVKENFKMLATDREIFENAWNIFKSQNKTKLSFTDCSILSAINKTGAVNLATFDKEFEKIEKINIYS